MMHAFINGFKTTRPHFTRKSNNTLKKTEAVILLIYILNVDTLIYLEHGPK